VKPGKQHTSAGVNKTVDKHEIHQEVLEHIEDPIAKTVWEKWIAQGITKLITGPFGGKPCIAQ